MEKQERLLGEVESNFCYARPGGKAAFAQEPAGLRQ